MRQRASMLLGSRIDGEYLITAHLTSDARVTFSVRPRTLSGKPSRKVLAVLESKDIVEDATVIDTHLTLTRHVCVWLWSLIGRYGELPF